MSVFLLINGPNLNRLGPREPDIYGATRLADSVDFIVLNHGGFAHTSVALREAFLAAQIPFVEFHLSKPLAREESRQNSHFSDVARSCFFGFGAFGYELALQAASHNVASTGD